MMLNDLSRAVGDLARETGRHIHLVLENDDNRASLLDPRNGPPGGKYRAQWNDDYHHAWHVLLTREKHGYYRDYQSNPRADIARMLSSGFAYQGEDIAAPRRTAARRAFRDFAADGFRELPAESRPDRQPRARRPAGNASRRSCVTCRQRNHAARANAAAPVHGRGMGIDKTVSVLL